MKHLEGDFGWCECRAFESSHLSSSETMTRPQRLASNANAYGHLLFEVLIGVILTDPHHALHHHRLIVNDNYERSIIANAFTLLSKRTLLPFVMKYFERVSMF